VLHNNVDVCKLYLSVVKALIYFIDLYLKRDEIELDSVMNKPESNSSLGHVSDIGGNYGSKTGP